jgi:hypothetical protein
MPFEMRPIQGFEGLYSVTSDGRVWAHEKRKGRGVHPGRWLRAGLSGSGYLSVVLIHGGVRKTVTVHRIVAKAWVPNDDPELRDEINHIDGVKAHNEASNLEWCTRSHNILHAYQIGLRQPHGGALSCEQVSRVRLLVAQGHRQIDVAARFGIARQRVHSIVHNRAYRA